MTGVLGDTGRVPTVDEPTPGVEAMRRNEFGAVWCPEHGRWEPTHLTKRRERCHQAAIQGTDRCRMHAGRPLAEAKAKGQAALKAQRFRDVKPDEYVDPVDVLLWSVTLARVDLADYRAGLHGRDVEPSEAELDRMSRLIMQAGQMSKMVLDAKIDARRLAIHEALGDRLTRFVRGLLMALGHNPNDPEVAMVARQQLELVASGPTV
jgi:hypothetical protein